MNGLGIDMYVFIKPSPPKLKLIISVELKLLTYLYP